MSRVAKNLIGSNLMPWDIPSEQQLKNMYELLEPYLGLYLWDQGAWNRYKRGGNSYSAAAATIWFLNSVSVETRLRLRKVIASGMSCSRLNRVLPREYPPSN
jgi:hypothetical protein